MQDRRPQRILSFLQLMMVMAAGFILWRLYELQFKRAEHYWRHARARQEYTIKKIPSRGKIYDRNGRELAVTEMVPTLYVSPTKIADDIKRDLARDLAKELEVDFDTIYDRLTRSRGDQVLHRRLTREQVDRVMLLAQVYRNKHRASRAKGTTEPIARNAFYVLEENKRVYPFPELAGHIIGYTQPDDTGDNLGVAGIEGWYNKELRGQVGVTTAPRTATGLPLEPLDPDVLASTYGHSVVLTIDREIQQATQEALRKQVNNYSADAGVAVVYAVKTGEVLAMASVPGFDLDKVRFAPTYALRNRAITDAIEPGSVMKIFTYATLIEEDKIRSFKEIVDCSGGRWTIAGRTVVDAHGMGAVPIVTAFAQSSNVAAAKLAVTRLAPAVFYRHLVDFGFGEKTGIDLPGEAPGLLRHVKDWTAQSVASLAYGYELQVTGIQMAAAVAAIANKGFYMKPHVAREVRNFRGEVVKKIEPETLRRVCSQETSKRMLELMEAVVKEGTGKAAAIPGYRVGGKTGTTIKLDPETKRYSRGNYISSFCGVAPLDDPEICIYIWIDNPRGGVYYGGQVAAPVFKEIATCALKVLRIPPSNEAPAETPNPVEVASARPEEPWFPIVPRAEEDGDRAPGTMPDLRGLTMREVHERLVQLNLPFDIKGSGVVIDQVPRPFETIDPRERVLVICGTAEEYRKRLAGEAQQPAQPTNNITMEAPNGGANQPVLKLRRGREEYEIPISSSQAATSNGSETRIKLPTPQSTPEPAEPTSVVEGEDPDARVRQGPLYDAGRSVWKKVIDNKLTQDAPPTRPAESTSDEGRNEAKKGSSRSPASAYEIGYIAKDQSDVSSSDSER